jgi:hypothetical protein
MTGSTGAPRGLDESPMAKARRQQRAAAGDVFNALEQEREV